MDFASLSKNKIKDLKTLHSKKKRAETRRFIVEGTKSISDYIKTFVPQHIICTYEWLNDNPQYKNYSELILIDKNKTGISQISLLSSPPDVIAVFKMPADPEDIPALDPQNYYLLLDNIQDPGNLGTIIRTCDWFGIYHIFASKDTVDIYNPKVIQATMGSLTRVQIQYLDLAELIHKNKSCKVFGALLDGTPLFHSTMEEGGMILMGNEGNGISESLKNLITEPITIPPTNQTDHPDSLNVAIATAVILSHIRLK